MPGAVFWGPSLAKIVVDCVQSTYSSRTFQIWLNLPVASLKSGIPECLGALPRPVECQP